MTIELISGVNFKEDPSLESAAKRWTEQVVLELFKSALLSKVKAFAKREEKKGTNVEEVQKLVEQWKPGGVRAVKNPVDELKRYLSSCSSHELPGELKKIEDLLMERKAGEEG